MHTFILLLHILAASIWTGGHLVLALTILPRVLREKSIAELLRFEAGFETVGIPALIIQVTTGIWLAHDLIPEITLWFSLENPLARLIMAKLCLLLMTLGLALDARLKIIPNLTQDNLVILAYHIIPVTLISVLFIVVGVSFRAGGLF